MALIRILEFFWDDSLLGSAQNIYFASSSEKTTTRRSVHLRLPRAGWAEQCSAVAEVPAFAQSGFLTRIEAKKSRFVAADFWCLSYQMYIFGYVKYTTFYPIYDINLLLLSNLRSLFVPCSTYIGNFYDFTALKQANLD